MAAKSSSGKWSKPSRVSNFSVDVLQAGRSYAAIVAEQIAKGDRRIIGVMLESNLVAGAQKLVAGQSLVYGQSITDACIGWDETLPLLRELTAAVRSTRSSP
jgi:3-deoxy-7-phosphoheptulonate synthase